MTIFVTWQLRVTLESIRNSCDVFIFSSLNPLRSRKLTTKTKQLRQETMQAALLETHCVCIGCSWRGIEDNQRCPLTQIMFTHFILCLKFCLFLMNHLLKILEFLKWIQCWKFWLFYEWICSGNMNLRQSDISRFTHSSTNC